MAILPQRRALITITVRCWRLLPLMGGTAIITMLRPHHRSTTTITKLRRHRRSTTIITTHQRHRRSTSIITTLQCRRRSMTVTTLQRRPRCTSTPTRWTLRVISSPMYIFILFFPGKCLIKGSFDEISNLTFPTKMLMAPLIVLKNSLPGRIRAMGCTSISITTR
uniref:Uncharacterized protein n=1 Tax=Aegilops tauschii subsp. strangulata TaxID=200361 RepID=A0A453CB08_AEGTS